MARPGVCPLAEASSSSALRGNSLGLDAAMVRPAKPTGAVLPAWPEQEPDCTSQVATRSFYFEAVLRLNSNSELEVSTTVAGSSRCDNLARVQRAKGTPINRVLARSGVVQKGTNTDLRSAPVTARGHRSAITLPTAEFGLANRMSGRWRGQ